MKLAPFQAKGSFRIYCQDFTARIRSAEKNYCVIAVGPSFTSEAHSNSKPIGSQADSKSERRPTMHSATVQDSNNIRDLTLQFASFGLFWIEPERFIAFTKRALIFAPIVQFACAP
jgi:hypothetical protein